MPYISTEEVKEIRTAIKKAFPSFKMSVTKDGSSGVTVAFMEGAVDLGVSYEQVNAPYVDQHHEGNTALIEVVTKAMNIINAVKGKETVHEDSDYGSIPNYYYYIHIGRWDKPYKVKAA